MMRLGLLFGMFLMILVKGNSQNSFVPDLSTFSTETLTRAAGQDMITFMTADEQKVVFYMNLVRLEPQVFLETIAKPYIEHNNLNVNSYVKSLYRDLQKSQSVEPLLMKQDLYHVAQAHAQDIGTKGLKGHTGSKGKTFEKRVQHLVDVYPLVSENVGLGFETPLDNLMGLLIDDGIKDLGHRKAILSASYNCIGVSLQRHKDYVFGCVMDFGKLRETSSSSQF